MRVALINENSQASKNSTIYKVLNDVCAKHGFELNNYGMLDDSDNSITYVQAGLLGAILLNSGASDFVVTGCGTGSGACLAMNSFPNVFCGLISDPVDAYLFAQINDGNAVSIPYAKGFGWGGEINLSYMFEKLFSEEFGNGYPKDRKEKEQFNKNVLCDLKKITCNNMIDILKNIDRDFLKDTISVKNFKEYFFKYATDMEIVSFIKEVIGE